MPRAKKFRILCRGQERLRILLQQRMQVLPDDVGDELIVAAIRQYAEQRRQRLESNDLSGCDRKLQLNIRSFVSEEFLDLRYNSFIKLCRVPRRFDTPSPDDGV